MRQHQSAKGTGNPAVARDDYLQVSPYETDGGQKIGLEPSSVSKDKLRALGHPESPMDAIRAKCIDCCGGSLAEVRKCTADDCPLWAFRMRRNPFHARAVSRTRVATAEKKDVGQADPDGDHVDDHTPTGQASA